MFLHTNGNNLCMMWAWPWYNFVAWTWGQRLQVFRRYSRKNVLQTEDVRCNFYWYLYMYIYIDMIISRRDKWYRWVHSLCVFWYLARTCRNEWIVFLLQWAYELLRNDENSAIINIHLFEWEFFLMRVAWLSQIVLSHCGFTWCEFGLTQDTERTVDEGSALLRLRWPPPDEFSGFNVIEMTCSLFSQYGLYWFIYFISFAHIYIFFMFCWWLYSYIFQCKLLNCVGPGFRYNLSYKRVLKYLEASMPLVIFYWTDN
jgi:hypothetical protein